MLEILRYLFCIVNFISVRFCLIMNDDLYYTLFVQFLNTNA